MDLISSNMGLIVVGAGAVILYISYAKVIKCKNSLQEALSGIDVQLKKRHDLIPNLLTMTKKFMTHEKELMENIVNLRNAAQMAQTGTKEKFDIENKLNNQLSSLMVQVENYPELKSDQTMVQTMRSLNEVEEQISAARRFYNSALTELKNAIMIFPGSLFASLAGDVSNFEYFQIDEAQKKEINVGEYL